MFALSPSAVCREWLCARPRERFLVTHVAKKAVKIAFIKVRLLFLRKTADACTHSHMQR